MSNDPIRTVPDNAGGWTNKRAGDDRGGETYDTKADAQAAAIEATLGDNAVDSLRGEPMG